MEIYQGPYELKPMLKKRRIARCRKKIADNNFKIHEIQKSITDNPQGGQTFYVKKDGEISVIQ